MKALNNRQHRIVIAAAVVIFTIATVVSIFVLAEYIKSSRTKRVLAALGNTGSIFSSNYLVMNTNTAVNVYRRIIYTEAAGQPASGNVTVCNYAQSSYTRHYETDIPYTLTARLVVLSESGGRYVKTNATAGDVGAHSVIVTLMGGATITLNAANLSHTFSGNVLDHRLSDTDVFSIEFDSDFINAGSLCLYMCASPDTTQAGVHTLDAVFNAALGAADARNTWEGEFNERTGTGVPQQPYYDGFNYVITGSGRGTCRIAWDNRKLQISQVFLNEQGLTPTVSGNKTYVDLAVDSDIVNRYDFQFYYADDTVTFANWAELTGSGGSDGYVTLTYTEAGS